MSGFILGDAVTVPGLAASSPFALQLMLAEAREVLITPKVASSESAKQLAGWELGRGAGGCLPRKEASEENSETLREGQQGLVVRLLWSSVG